MRIDYNFSGQDFSTFGVFVSESEGLLGKTKRKKPETYEYPGESGHIADLSTIAYEPRTIKLSCFIESDTTEQLITAYQNLTTLLYGQTANKNLILKLNSQEKLIFNVYVNEISDLKKRFRDGTNVGTFTITFIEPQPQ
jgi:predicted transport protein